MCKMRWRIKWARKRTHLRITETGYKTSSFALNSSLIVCVSVKFCWSRESFLASMPISLFQYSRIQIYSAVEDLMNWCACLQFLIDWNVLSYKLKRVKEAWFKALQLLPKEKKKEVWLTCVVNSTLELWASFECRLPDLLLGFSPITDKKASSMNVIAFH